MMDMARLDLSLETDQFHPQDVIGRKTEVNKTFSNSDHHKQLIEAAYGFCQTQEYTDLHIQCEDGVISAHQMVLAVSSPLLKQLFQMALLDQPVSLFLPEVKVGLVQSLLHFIYTGNVVTQEGQFYSLMKLIYSLNINANIDAESTKAVPTQFKTEVMLSSQNQTRDSSEECTCSFARKRRKVDKENNFLDSMNFNEDNNGLIVNSLTASGVVVKEEPDEKSNLITDSVMNNGMINLNFPHGDLISGLNLEATGTNRVNNNQVDNFVSVNPGYQIKMELINQNDSPIPTDLKPRPTSSPYPQNQAKHDDPLAAIMNQTIFGGDGSAGNVQKSSNTPYKHGPNKSNPSNSPGGNKTNSDHHFEENVVEDDDPNTEYNCDTCNRSIKGKVMLQAHKYQEHHENVEYESGKFPQDKFPCRVCLKLFTRNSDVKAHILRVHCGDRRYPCTTCGKRFKESTHLRKHMYTHTGERPHYCSLCNKGFQTSSDLKRHTKTRVHQEKVEQGGDITVTTTNNNLDSTDPDLDLESSSSNSITSVSQVERMTFGTSDSAFSPDQMPLFNTYNPDAQDITTFSTMTNSIQSNQFNPQTMQTNNMMVPHVSACSLPNTTLDLSDIKWGIMEQSDIQSASLDFVKRSSSTEDQDDMQMTTA